MFCVSGDQNPGSQAAGGDSWHPGSEEPADGKGEKNPASGSTRLTDACASSATLNPTDTMMCEYFLFCFCAAWFWKEPGQTRPGGEAHHQCVVQHGGCTQAVISASLTLLWFLCFVWLLTLLREWLCTRKCQASDWAPPTRPCPSWPSRDSPPWPGEVWLDTSHDETQAGCSNTNRRLQLDSSLDPATLFICISPHMLLLPPADAVELLLLSLCGGGASPFQVTL